MSKEESFEEWYSSHSGYENAVEKDLEDYYISGMVRICQKAWNHQQAKLDKANERIESYIKLVDSDTEAILKLESENKQLKETLKLAVELNGDMA